MSLNRESFMRNLCELDKVARQNGEATTFPLKETWRGKGFDQPTYSKPTIQELIDEKCIYRDDNDRISLTGKGRMTYCP
jgi:hypothetical protein